MNVVQLDFTFEHRLEMQREEALQQGIDLGISTGEEKKTISLVIKKILKGKDIPTIADELEDEESHIAKICSVAEKYAPDYDIDKILKELTNK